MATVDADDAAERVARQLAAVVIAAVRPDPGTSDANPDSGAIGAAVERLGGELGDVLRQLEPRHCAEDTMPTVVDADSAVARAARLAARIMLSGSPRDSGAV